MRPSVMHWPAQLNARTLFMRVPLKISGYPILLERYLPSSPPKTARQHKIRFWIVLGDHELGSARLNYAVVGTRTNRPPRPGFTHLGRQECERFCCADPVFGVVFHLRA